MQLTTFFAILNFLLPPIVVILFCYFIYRVLKKNGIAFIKADDFFKQKLANSDVKQGSLLDIELVSKYYMDSLNHSLVFKVRYEVDGYSYICKKSPYSPFGSSNIDCAQYILNRIKASDYALYVSRNDPSDSFIIVKNLFSWDEVEALSKD